MADERNSVTTDVYFNLHIRPVAGSGTSPEALAGALQSQVRAAQEELGKRLRAAHAAGEDLSGIRTSKEVGSDDLGGFIDVKASLGRAYGATRYASRRAAAVASAADVQAQAAEYGVSSAGLGAAMHAVQTAIPGDVDTRTGAELFGTLSSGTALVRQRVAAERRSRARGAAAQRLTYAQEDAAVLFQDLMDTGLEDDAAALAEAQWGSEEVGGAQRLARATKRGRQSKTTWLRGRTRDRDIRRLRWNVQDMADQYRETQGKLGENVDDVLMARVTSALASTSGRNVSPLAEQELRDAAQQINRNAQVQGRILSKKEREEAGAETPDSIRRAAARFMLRGAVSGINQVTSGYINQGYEGLTQGGFGLAQSAGTAAMGAGLLMGGPVGWGIAGLGAVLNVGAGIGGALYQRGTQLRRSGTQAMFGLEQASRYSLYAAPGVADAGARTRNMQMRGAAEGEAAAHPLASSLRSGESNYWLLHMAEAERQLVGYQKPQMEMSAADWNISEMRRVTRRLAYRYAVPQAQMQQYVSDVVSGAKFNVFEGGRNAFTDPLGLYAPPTAFEQTVSQGFGLGVSAGTTRESMYLRRRGVVRDTFAGAGVGRTFGWTGAALNAEQEFLNSLGARSLSKLGSTYDTQDLAGTMASLGRQGQAGEAANAYATADISSAEQARGFFQGPMKGMRAKIRLMLAAQQGGSITDMMNAASGFSASTVDQAAANVFQDNDLQRLFLSTAGLDVRGAMPDTRIGAIPESRQTGVPALAGVGAAMEVGGRVLDFAAAGSSAYILGEKMNDLAEAAVALKSALDQVVSGAGEGAP